jgi:hypothetical protein
MHVFYLSPSNQFHSIDCAQMTIAQIVHDNEVSPSSVFLQYVSHITYRDRNFLAIQTRRSTLKYEFFILLSHVLTVA